MGKVINAKTIFQIKGSFSKLEEIRDELSKENLSDKEHNLAKLSSVVLLMREEIPEFCIFTTSLIMVEEEVLRSWCEYANIGIDVLVELEKEQFLKPIKFKYGEDKQRKLIAIDYFKIKRHFLNEEV